MYRWQNIHSYIKILWHHLLLTGQQASNCVNFPNAGLLLTLLLTFLPTFTMLDQVIAVDFDSCASAARRLRDAADEASSAKSSFESACGSFGYSHGDDMACGPYGYERSRLESALSDFDDTRSHTARSCGFSLRSTPDPVIMHQQSQIDSLQGRLKACEATSKRPVQ